MQLIQSSPQLMTCLNCQSMLSCQCPQVKHWTSDMLYVWKIQSYWKILEYGTDVQLSWHATEFHAWEAMKVHPREVSLRRQDRCKTYMKIWCNYHQVPCRIEHHLLQKRLCTSHSKRYVLLFECVFNDPAVLIEMANNMQQIQPSGTRKSGMTI